MPPKWRGGRGGWRGRGGRGGRGGSSADDGATQGDDGGTPAPPPSVRDTIAGEQDSGVVDVADMATIHQPLTLKVFLTEYCLPPTLLSGSNSEGGGPGAAGGMTYDRTATSRRLAEVAAAAGQQPSPREAAPSASNPHQPVTPFGSISANAGANGTQEHADDAGTLRPPPGARGRAVVTLEVDFHLLICICPSMYQVLVEQGPERLVHVLRAEYVQCWHDTLRQEWGSINPELLRLEDGAMMTSLSVRLINLPFFMRVPSISIHDTDRLVKLTGTVIRLCAPRVVPFVSEVVCRRCGATSEVRSSPHHRGELVRVRCGGSKCKGEVMSVQSQQFMDYTECRIQQRPTGDDPILELLSRMQASKHDGRDPWQHRGGAGGVIGMPGSGNEGGGGDSGGAGRIPRSVLVTLDDELGSRCGVGDTVEIVGVPKPRWLRLGKDRQGMAEMVIWAVNVVPQNAGAAPVQVQKQGPGAEPGENGAVFDPVEYAARRLGAARGGVEALRAGLVRSVCPHLCGLYGPRLGILLAALGGVTMNTKGVRVRGTAHMLMVGDPSTGKSQLLRYAAQLAPRSTSTTGMTSTSAGLTVAATKEFGEWALEPGALVLADGGTCVIDELRTINPSDRTVLHEAMEQQTISVAKAGIVARLRTVCSVVAACNPPSKGARSNGDALQATIGVGAALLSRFDLVFLLWDEKGHNQRKDIAVARHVLSYAQQSNSSTTGAGMVVGGGSAGARASTGDNGMREDDDDAAALLELSEMKAFLGFVRNHFAAATGSGEDTQNADPQQQQPPGQSAAPPQLSPPAAALLSHYFTAVRQRGPSAALADGVPITVRLLESLIRLTQAHAKLTLQDVCTRDDALIACFMLERSAHGLKLPLPNLVYDKHAGKVVRLSADDGSDRFEPLYTSSQCVDDLFLSGSADAIRQQRWVLSDVEQAIMAVTGGGPMLGPQGGSDAGGNNAPFFAEDRLEEDPQMVEMVVDAPSHDTVTVGPGGHVESTSRPGSVIERRLARDALLSAFCTPSLAAADRASPAGGDVGSRRSRQEDGEGLPPRRLRMEDASSGGGFAAPDAVPVVDPKTGSVAIQVRQGTGQPVNVPPPLASGRDAQTEVGSLRALLRQGGPPKPAQAKAPAPAAQSAPPVHPGFGPPAQAAAPSMPQRAVPPSLIPDATPSAQRSRPRDATTMSPDERSALLENNPGMFARQHTVLSNAPSQAMPVAPSQPTITQQDRHQPPPAMNALSSTASSVARMPSSAAPGGGRRGFQLEEDSDDDEVELLPGEANWLPSALSASRPRVAASVAPPLPQGMQQREPSNFMPPPAQQQQPAAVPAPAPPPYAAPTPVVALSAPAPAPANDAWGLDDDDLEDDGVELPQGFAASLGGEPVTSFPAANPLVDTPMMAPPPQHHQHQQEPAHSTPAGAPPAPQGGVPSWAAPALDGTPSVTPTGPRMPSQFAGLQHLQHQQQHPHQREEAQLAQQDSYGSQLHQDPPRAASRYDGREDSYAATPLSQDGYSGAAPGAVGWNTHTQEFSQDAPIPPASGQPPAFQQTPAASDGGGTASGEERTRRLGFRAGGTGFQPPRRT